MMSSPIFSGAPFLDPEKGLTFPPTGPEAFAGSTDPVLRLVPPSTRVGIESHNQYVASPLYHLTRKRMTNLYMVPQVGETIAIEGEEVPAGIDSVIADALNFHDGDTLVDVGCGDGGFLKLMAQRGHRGEFIGVEKFHNNYLVGEVELAGGEEAKATFIPTDAHDLSMLPDGEVDIVTHNFTLYHLENPIQALQEAIRILRPGGQLAVAVRSPGHHERLWGFMETMALEAARRGPDWADDRAWYQTEGRLIVPRTFYQHFDINTARQVLQGLGLDINWEYMQSSFDMDSPSELHIPGDKKGWDDYLLALISIMDLFQPKPKGRAALEMIEEIVRPEFEREVAEVGYFTERVHQGLFIATKPGG